MEQFLYELSQNETVILYTITNNIFSGIACSILQNDDNQYAFDESDSLKCPMNASNFYEVEDFLEITNMHICYSEKTFHEIENYFKSKNQKYFAKTEISLQTILQNQVDEDIMSQPIMMIGNRLSLNCSEQEDLVILKNILEIIIDSAINSKQIKLKDETKIYYIDRWKLNGNHPKDRWYVKTNFGEVYYDNIKKEWYEKRKDTFLFIKKEKIQKKVLSLLHIETIEEFEKLKQTRILFENTEEVEKLLKNWIAKTNNFPVQVFVKKRQTQNYLSVYYF